MSSHKFVITYQDKSGGIGHAEYLAIDHADVRQKFSNADYYDGCTLLNVTKRGKMERAEAYALSRSRALGGR